MLRSKSRNPKIAIGIPTGAATSDIESAIPMTMKIRPLIPAMTRPVSFMKKLNTAHTITKGKNMIGVFLC